MSDSKCVSRNSVNYFFLTTFRRHMQAIQKPICTLEAVLKFNYGTPSIPKTNGTIVAPGKPLPLLNHPLLLGKIRQVAQDEAMRTYVLEMDKSFVRVAEEAFSSTF